MAKTKTTGVAPSAGQTVDQAARPNDLATPDIPAWGPEKIRYRALAPCRVGYFREVGEEFAWPRFAECPEHLEELDVPRNRPTKAGGGEKQPTAFGVTLSEMFGEE